MTKAIHVTITGRVQGVSYRAWTESTARKHQVGGWVRNRADGSVEAVFAGDETQLKTMLKACHKGPLFARVDHITTAETDEQPDTSTFVIKPTL